MSEREAALTPGPSYFIDLLGRAGNESAFSMVNQQWLDHFKPPMRGRQHQSADSIPANSSALIWSDWERPFDAFVKRRSTPAFAVRPWDFGPYPASWVDTIAREFEQLWVHSHWIREKAIEGGVDETKVVVIPLGADLDVYRPDGPSFPLPGDHRFTFLFVGAAVQRKGLDKLLKAFAAEFEPEEPVRLVVKDRPVEIFYGGLQLDDDLERLSAHQEAGSFIRLQEHLDEASLSALYRTADVAVFPYRAEGFAMPILEALACGTPTLVPKFGACLDYCDENTSFFAPHRRIALPIHREMVYNTLGFRAAVDAIDFCEVSVEGLRATLRLAFETPSVDLEGKALAAAARASTFSWAQSVRGVEQALRPFL